MSKSSINRQIGSVFLIIGTEIGAGVQALPLLLAPLGVLWGSFVLIFAWFIMLITALMICEIIFTLPGNVTFISIAKEYLGTKGKIVMIVIFWFTLSSITMAYISAASSTLNYLFTIPSLTAAVLFVVVFGVIVIAGTKAVDYINRVLIGISLIILIISILSLVKTVDLNDYKTTTDFSKILFVMPAIATAFILHNIIPSLRIYLGYDKKTLRRVIIIGSLMPLIIYVVWIFSIFGNIPQNGPFGFESIFIKSKDTNIGDLLNLISFNTNGKNIINMIIIITTMSITAAFLGTSISFYHFSKDIFTIKKYKFVISFVLPVLLTFAVPLFIVLTFPDIFISALGYTGSGAIILFIIFPVLMTKSYIKRTDCLKSRFLHNKILQNLLLILGIGILFLQIF